MGNNEYTDMEIEVTNEAETTDGSNALIVGILDDLIGLDRDDKIITEFHAHLKFRERNSGEIHREERTVIGEGADADGNKLEVSLDTKSLKDLNQIIELSKRISPDEFKLIMYLHETSARGFLSSEQFSEFQNRFRKLYRIAYDGEDIGRRKRVGNSFIYDADIDEFNQAMKLKGIPFVIREKREDFVGSTYIINRLDN